MIVDFNKYKIDCKYIGLFHSYRKKKNIYINCEIKIINNIKNILFISYLSSF